MPPSSSAPESSKPQRNGWQHVRGYTVGLAVFLLIIPAIFWFLATLGFPPFSTPLVPFDGLRLVLASLLGGIGVVFMIWSNLFLFFEGKGGPANVGGIKISPLTRKLATHGPYRYSRNPMVFGTNCFYLAMIVQLNSLGAFLAHMVFFVVLVRSVIRKEEQRLARDFGSDYADYKAHTSRFMPLPPFRRNPPSR